MVIVLNEDSGWDWGQEPRNDVFLCMTHAEWAALKRQYPELDLIPYDRD